jgi:hypothetical protein
MKFLKKWSIIAGIYFGSLLALGLIAKKFKPYFDFDPEVWIFYIYFGILVVWIIYQMYKAIFKVSALFMRSYYLLLAKFYFQKKYPQVDFKEFSTNRLLKMCYLRIQSKDIDLPLLSDEEIDLLTNETNKKNIDAVGKGIDAVGKGLGEFSKGVGEVRAQYNEGAKSPKIICRNCGFRLQKIFGIGDWTTAGMGGGKSSCEVRGDKHIAIEAYDG